MIATRLEGIPASELDGSGITSRGEQRGRVGDGDHVGARVPEQSMADRVEFRETCVHTLGIAVTGCNEQRGGQAPILRAAVSSCHDFVRGRDEMSCLVTSSCQAQRDRAGIHCGLLSECAAERLKLISDLVREPDRLLEETVVEA